MHEGINIIGAPRDIGLVRLQPSGQHGFRSPMLCWPRTFCRERDPSSRILRRRSCTRIGIVHAGGPGQNEKRRLILVLGFLSEVAQDVAPASERVEH